MSGPETAASPAGARRWLVIGLFASLAVNIFLVGWLAASAFRPAPAPDPRPTAGGPPPPQPFRFLAARRELAPEQRQAVDKIWRDQRPALREKGEALRASRQALLAALTADALDERALEAAIRDLRARSDEVLELIHRQIVETARILPTDARKKFFAVGFARPEGPPPRRPPGPGGPPGERRPP